MESEPKNTVEERAEEENINLDKAFVEEDKRVLDPSLLDKSVLERMPQPTGWRLLVLPYRGKGVSEGGIQGRYAGSRFRLADESEVRIINDDEVIATILNPDDIVSV